MEVHFLLQIAVFHISNSSVLSHLWHYAIYIFGPITSRKCFKQAPLIAITIIQMNKVAC